MSPSCIMLQSCAATLAILKASSRINPNTSIVRLPFYQFTQPSVSASPCSVNPLDFFDSFSVRLLRGQGPQNATYGDRDSSPGDPPNARAGDPTGPLPAARRPPQWLSTATRPTRPN